MRGGENMEDTSQTARPESRTDSLLGLLEKDIAQLEEKLIPVLINKKVEQSEPMQTESTQLNSRLSVIEKALNNILKNISI